MKEKTSEFEMLQAFFIFWLRFSIEDNKLLSLFETDIQKQRTIPFSVGMEELGEFQIRSQCILIAAVYNVIDEKNEISTQIPVLW